MASRLTWSQKLDEIQRRQSEANAASSPGLDIPYFVRSDIEQVLWEVSNAKLGSLSVEEIGTVDTSVVTVISGASPLILPAGMIDIISATIDGSADVEVMPAHWFWLYGSSTAKYYCVMKNAGTGARSIYHSGTTATFAILVEASLATWQSNAPILPPAYDEECINEVCVLLEIEDFVEDPFRRTLDEKKELVT